MTRRPAFLALAALCTVAQAAEEVASRESPLLLFDAHRVSAYGNFGMEFDRSPGELDAWQAELHTFLSTPIPLVGDLAADLPLRRNLPAVRWDPARIPCGR